VLIQSNFVGDAKSGARAQKVRKSPLSRRSSLTRRRKTQSAKPGADNSEIAVYSVMGRPPALVNFWCKNTHLVYVARVRTLHRFVVYLISGVEFHSLQCGTILAANWTFLSPRCEIRASSRAENFCVNQSRPPPERLTHG
jgi:hypothetical protein